MITHGSALSLIESLRNATEENNPRHHYLSNHVNLGLPNPNFPFVLINGIVYINIFLTNWIARIQRNM